MSGSEFRLHLERGVGGLPQESIEQQVPCERFLVVGLDWAPTLELSICYLGSRSLT